MFSDVEVLQAMSYDRAIRSTVADAQTLVDRKNRQIGALQRQLADSQRETAALRAEVEALRAERGRAGVEQLHRIRALKGRSTH